MRRGMICKETVTVDCCEWTETLTSLPLKICCCIVWSCRVTGCLGNWLKRWVIPAKWQPQYRICGIWRFFAWRFIKIHDAGLNEAKKFKYPGIAYFIVHSKAAIPHLA